MRSRDRLAGLGLMLLTGGVFTFSALAEPFDIPSNRDGSTVTGIVTANFDPANGVVPFPTNLLLSGTTDLTLNIPVEDPNDFSNPRVAMNALDGFSTVAPWTTTFSVPLDPSSVQPGRNVQVFEVSLTSPGGAVTGVERRLRPGRDYTAVLASPTTLAVIPLQPLDPLTTYMVVLTDGLNDTDGNDVTPSQTYFLAKRTDSLVDANGSSTEPLLPDATARALEPLRQLVNSQEAAAASKGMSPQRIVLSWTATTQSTFHVLGALRSVIEPAESLLAPSGQNTSIAGLPGLADIYFGRMDMPYYLDAPTPDNPDPTQILNTFWEAAPGAYIPPFNAFGLDPTSTHVTAYNPFPEVEAVYPIPVLITVPNQNSGHSKPASGWPVVIFQHGITRNRMDALAVADTLALAGFAVVAIDLPLHGITQRAALLYGGNVPPPLRATERTFNVDLIDNETGAPGPDGKIDPSGEFFVNLASLLTTRDNARQAAADISVLAETVPTMDINQDGQPDFDGSRVHFVGLSNGGIVGIPALAVEPRINAAVLSAVGGGLANLLEASPTFGPQIREGLRRGAGLEPGTADYRAYFVAAQTVIDSADPINFGELAAQRHPVLLHEIVGGPESPPDQVVPNSVPGAPLSGTEPLIRVMGLDAITGSVQDPDGVRGAVRFITGSHGSLIDPSTSPATTVEMQTQMASMVASDGRAVQVADPSVIQTGN